MAYNPFITTAWDFEKEVIEFIESLLSREERKQYKERKNESSLSSSYVPGMLLPKGCKKLGWERPAIVELKYHPRLDTLQTFYTRMKRDFLPGQYEFVFIYEPNPFVLLPKIKDDTFKMFSANELYRLAKKERQGIDESSTKTNYNQEDVGYEKAFLQSQSTLFIGAGVSISAGLPGWNELLERIAKNIINKDPSKDDIKVIEQLCNSSTIVEARFLKTLLKERLQVDEEKIDECFTMYVKQALYNKPSAKQTDLLDSIVDLVIENKDRVCNIITYNFDDLLEQRITKKMKIETDFANRYNIIAKELLPIIHVHGVIPKQEEYGGGIILSEDSYHELYNNPYSRVNVVQLNALQNTTCFFIGLSMSDPSLRRLLEASKRSDGSMHYAFLSEENLNATIGLGTNKKEVVEEMFLELGVKVIWYEKYENLPGIIREMGKQKRDSIKDK